MNLKEIIRYNTNYEAESKLLQDKLSNMKDNILNINKNLNLKDVKTLSYDEARQIKKILYYNLDNDQQKELDSIIKTLKENEYPILKKAHYYPVINEMEFLSDKQKNKLDELLRHSYNKYIYTSSMSFCDLQLDNTTVDKVLIFLYEKGIVEKLYAIKCGCRQVCNEKHISQKEYDEFIKHHSVSQEEINNMTDEEYEIHENEFVNIYVDCENDHDVEVDDIYDFKEKAKLYGYRNIMKPDLSLDKL